ncbi:MAG TPA: glycosyltransferase [Paludibacter sp.]|nr:glycosyltransferase [Paludibacter sp.]
MRLSIIIPVYNVAEYLPQCLDSVFMQDLTGCEVICINDGSTDNSRAILTEYQKKFPELIIVDTQNGGLSAARNSGLKVAQGEYVYFLDSDDYLYPGVVSEMLRFAEGKKLEVACFNVLKNGKRPYFENDFKNEDILTGVEYCKRFFQNFGFYYPAPVWMYLYKRIFLVNNNLYFSEGKLHEDEDFTPRVMFYANRVSLLNISVQYHRVGREGAITNSTTIKHLSDSTAICRNLYQFFNEQQNTEPIFYHNIYFFYLVTLIKAYENNLLAKRKLFFKRNDAILMLSCAQSDYERKCAKLACISISLTYRYYRNRLNYILSRIINRIL